MIDKCKTQKYDFVQQKNKLLGYFGEDSVLLPDSTVNSLTTAEMLFEQYASKEYEKEGFDFSCISALYFQAFEEAYNSIIWKDYAAKLNDLVIEGQKYTSILENTRYRGIDILLARGYLDPDPKQRAHYVDYANAYRNETSVSMSCMYKSFAILMKSVNSRTQIEKFCDYFAGLAGFRSKDEMFEDESFMEECYAFTACVDESAVDRNNASHGGTIICLGQCMNDKRTVLYDLEMLRTRQMGLVLRLLRLIGRSPKRKVEQLKG